jgi:hypothetical protein
MPDRNKKAMVEYGYFGRFVMNDKSKFTDSSTRRYHNLLTAFKKMIASFTYK